MHIQSTSFRTWHRWLSLIVGLQMLIWAISGGYMVFFKLPFIHGVHLTQAADQPIQEASQQDQFLEVLKRYPEAHDVRWVNRFVQGRYQDLFQVHAGDEKFLVSPDSFTRLELTAADIRALAERYYKKGEPRITQVQLLRDQAPTELNPNHLPIWRIDFDDFGNTSLYLHRATGEMTVRRHDFWRGFDIMWMLHIMDYKDRTDITTWWLRAFILATFAFTFTGTILVLQTLRTSKRKPL